MDVLTTPGHHKNGRYVSAHLHLACSFLLTADEASPLRAKPDENSGVSWIETSDLAKCCEPHMLPVYEKLLQKGRAL